MKVFFDTNVLIAAFLTRGLCSDVFEYCLTEHKIYTSQWVIDEVSEKLSEKLGFSKIKTNQVITFIKENSLLITYTPFAGTISRDPDDDHVLAASIKGAADCLITGDEDLLVLKKFKGIPIIKPSDFFKFEKGN